MSQGRRLSEMIGLEPARPAHEAAWPTNVALACLGAAILWITFRFLKPDDPRPLFNPWTYTLVTPLMLVSLSLLLRQVVSRVVERSAQVAFLLSVMVHLVLLVCALDVVIVTRMWPAFFDSLAQEKREMLERQRVPPKYFNVAASSAVGAKRPDYLRYVPTEHEATQTDLSDQKPLQLARSEQTQIVSPDPRTTPTLEPHLIERQQSAEAMAIKVEAPAALSRAELGRPVPARTDAESIDVPAMDASPPELSAADTNSSRSRRGDSNLPLAARALAELSSPDATPPPPLGLPGAIARESFQPSLAAADATPLRDRADLLEADSPSAAVVGNVPVPDIGGIPQSATPRPADLSPSSTAAGNRWSSATRGSASLLNPLEPTPAPGAASARPLGNVARADGQPTAGRPEGQPGGAGLDFGNVGLPRGELGGGSAPAGAGRIEVPETVEDGAGIAAGSGSGLGPSTQAGSSRRRPRTGAPGGQLRLDIDAPTGLGGLSLEPGQGPLIARSSPSVPTLDFPSLDIERFSRDDVGGPLAGGVAGPVPTPAFQQRIERLKEEAGGDEGPTGPQTEQAIERGLQFLARHQRPDGSWRLQDLDKDVLIRSDTAATGLCLLAFQGAGYTHKQYKYASVNDKALKFLIRNQRPTGDLYIPQDPASDQNAWLYSHGIAALALCEAYGMTQDPELRPAAQAAVNFMVDSQEKQRGGWRYRPGVGSDTSVTGWFMMALKSAQLARLDVPQVTFERMAGYLQASQASAAQPHLFRYNPYAADTPEQRHGLQPTHVMTSVGLLMRLYLGWRRELPEMQAGADYLLSYPPNVGTPALTRRDTYYWYYATQVLFHMGGERWKRWNDQLRPLLLDSQITSGPLEGSWDPYLPTADLWSRYGGRLYVTTLNLLSLEVHYRHLPLYEATAQ